MKKTKQKSIKEELKDNFILTILNDDNIVKIGKWLIKLNFNSEKVFVVSANTPDNYKLLLNEEVKNMLVYEFSFEDEVLVLLKEGLISEEKGWFNPCRDPKPARFERSFF